MNGFKMLIGSKAAKLHFPDFSREPHDTDYIVRGERCVKKTVKGREESYACPVFDEILDRYPFEVATPEVLYTLKLSHAFWDIHWSKTMGDIAFFQKKGVVHIPELLEKLYLQWETIHGSKKGSLKKTNEDFFKDNVGRKYVHDDIHQAIAYHDRPLYEAIKGDKSLALTSKNLFDKLTNLDKLRLCREEIYVTALERILIPKNFTANRLFAYREGARMLVTSMSKGWFPKFIVLNWNELKDLDNHPYREKFQEALTKGQIQTDGTTGT